MAGEQKGGKLDKNQVVDEPNCTHWDSKLEKMVKLTTTQLFSLCAAENVNLIVTKEIFERDEKLLKKVADRFKFRRMQIINQKGVLTYVRFQLKKEFQDEQAPPVAPFVSAQRM